MQAIFFNNKESDFPESIPGGKVSNRHRTFTAFLYPPTHSFFELEFTATADFWVVIFPKVVIVYQMTILVCYLPSPGNHLDTM
jgi:hypothetical protein